MLRFASRGVGQHLHCTTVNGLRHSVTALPSFLAAQRRRYFTATPPRRSAASPPGQDAAVYHLQSDATTSGGDTHEGKGIVLGNPAHGVRCNLDSVYHRSEFVGKLFPLLRPRTDAGDVLAIVDVCAGRAAYFHISGNVFGGRLSPTNGFSMATVAFNSFIFTQPIYEGDLILIESRVIHVGSSSVGVFLEVRRQAYDSPVPSPVGESYVTMVVVDAADVTKTASGQIPAVQLIEAADMERNREYHQLRAHAKDMRKAEAASVLTAASVEHPANRRKKQRFPLSDCVTRTERCFGVGDMNMNEAVFGGELLRFMEKCALHCGRVFARHARLFTLGMLDMIFEGPVFIEDLASCKAQVVCVRRSTLLVNVKVAALAKDGTIRSTNRSSFLLVAADSNGIPFEIPNGIDLEGATMKELATYWRGRRMMEDAAKRRRTTKADRAKQQTA